MVPNLFSVVTNSLLSFAHKWDPLPEGGHRFTYESRFYKVTVVRSIDAAGQWKLLRPSIEILRELGFSEVAFTDRA